MTDLEIVRHFILTMFISGKNTLPICLSDIYMGVTGRSCGRRWVGFLLNTLRTPKQI